MQQSRETMINNRIKANGAGNFPREFSAFTSINYLGLKRSKTQDKQ